MFLNLVLYSHATDKLIEPQSDGDRITTILV